MTLKPVIEGSKASLGKKLEAQINEYLDCAYDYRKRRFKHSQGLFPAEVQSDPFTHIQRKYAVNKDRDKVIQIFCEGGYLPSYYGSESYLTPIGKKSRSREEILSRYFGSIIWAEAGQSVENSEDN
jgi:hypothetical protein